MLKKLKEIGGKSSSDYVGKIPDSLEKSNFATKEVSTIDSRGSVQSVYVVEWCAVAILRRYSLVLPGQLGRSRV